MFLLHHHVIRAFFLNTLQFTVITNINASMLPRRDCHRHRSKYLVTYFSWKFYLKQCDEIWGAAFISKFVPFRGTNDYTLCWIWSISLPKAKNDIFFVFMHEMHHVLIMVPFKCIFTSFCANKKGMKFPLHYKESLTMGVHWKSSYFEQNGFHRQNDHGNVCVFKMLGQRIDMYVID